MTSRAVGIDLGTTYSSVAVYKSGRVEVISNNYSSRLTPSYVAFTEDEILVGEAARNQLGSNPTNTVSAVKRLIGRRFNEPCVQNDMKLWPFKVIAKDQKPLIEVKLKGQTKRYTPENISSMVLTYLKKTAEKQLSHEVTDAVITVPANYGDMQRQATFDAAREAGLNVLRLLNEPTAAALAYGLEKGDIKNRQMVLVFDFGGGTLDVSILEISKDFLFDVKATAGDMHLGGDDFDNCLANHFAAQFAKTFKDKLLDNSKAIFRLKAACERAKKAVSDNDKVSLELDALHKGQDFYTKLSREEFENVCGHLLDKITAPIRQALENAQLTKRDIDEVVLTGGSSRVPKVQAIIKKFFDGKELNTSISPDEAVVIGAASMAAKLSDAGLGASVKGMILNDILGMSLGFGVLREGIEGCFAVVIPRSSHIPCKNVKRGLTASADFVTEVKVDIYEGEDEKVNKNNFLGCFSLSGFPARLKLQTKFECTMEIDENGILHVSFVELGSGKSNETTLTRRF